MGLLKRFRNYRRKRKIAKSAVKFFTGRYLENLECEEVFDSQYRYMREQLEYNSQEIFYKGYRYFSGAMIIELDRANKEIAFYVKYYKNDKNNRQGYNEFGAALGRISGVLEFMICNKLWINNNDAKLRKLILEIFEIIIQNLKKAHPTINQVFLMRIVKDMKSRLELGQWQHKILNDIISLCKS